MDRTHYYAVIMAGGGGTRLWPLSRKKTPKQFLSLDGDRSLFQLAVDRLDGLFDPDHIYVVTIEEQAALLQRQCPQIPSANFILEPLPRGTASVVGLAAAVLRKRDPLATMAVLTADHFIKNEKYFRLLLEQAYEVAQQDYLVTLGIEPLYAATGYGYLQQGEALPMGFDKNSTYQVQSFREKPDLETAERFLAEGGFYWNSGMFIWRAEMIWQEIKNRMPQLFRVIQWIYEVLGEEEETVILHSLWHTIKPDSIDYGIMEKANRVAMLTARGMGWNDVGSWDALDEVLPKDEDNNILVSAQHIGINTHGMVICSDKTDRLIVTIGMQDVIVIDTRDVLLICRKENAQQVKEMVAHLKRIGLEQYL